VSMAAQALFLVGRLNTYRLNEQEYQTD